MITTMKSTINVFMAEDEALFGELLQSKLASVPGITVAGIARDGESTVRIARELKPDAMIVDSNLVGSMSGIQTATEIKKTMPDMGMVLLTSLEDRRNLRKFPFDDTVGWAYLARQSVPDVASIVRAVHGSVMGMVTLDPEIMDSMRPQNGSPLTVLTVRQLEVLDLMARGFHNGAIAERLTLNLKSVETYVHDIYRALLLHEDVDAHPRVSAALLYIEEIEAHESMRRSVSLN